MEQKLNPNTEHLVEKFVNMFVPSEYLCYFELFDVEIKPDCYEIILHEKKDQLPKGLEGKNAVLDGFCRPISILCGSVLNKKVYLVVKRRRWKEAGTNQHYENTYELHPKGARITKEYAGFLKKNNRGLSDIH